MKHKTLLLLPFLLLGACATQKDESSLDPTMQDAAKVAVINAEGDKVLKDIPPLPEGKKFSATEPTFRSRRLVLPDGIWTVNFENGVIALTAPGGKSFSLPMAWYPEEGGADGAFCTAYVSRGTTWIVLAGSSDYYNEVTRIRFEKRAMKEVIKHRVPGGLSGAVPAEERIKSAAF